MAAIQPSPARAITLDQLIALNEEIGALVRAGVPLEHSLSALGRDMPGKLGKIAVWIAEELERGQPLAEVFHDLGAQVPPIYRAVLEAGIRSGRLAGALESMAHSARRIGDMRRLIAGAILYPLMVFVLAWCLLTVFVAEVVPRFVPVFEDFDVRGVQILRMIARLGESVGYWGPAVPAVVLLVVGLWWYWTTRASLAEPRLAARLLGWLPGIGGVLRSLRATTFSEVLALLVENRVPLDEGLRLASGAAGDPRIARAARATADSLQSGCGLPEGQPACELPPLVRWMIAAGQGRGMLAPALRHAAEMYRKRAIHQAESARLVIPVLLTLVVGGGITLFYVLLLLGPWIALLRSLARL